MRAGPSIRTKIFLKILEKANYGTVVATLPDGVQKTYGNGNPEISIEVKDWSFFDKLFLKGDIALAEQIISGEVKVSDASLLIEWACRNDKDLRETFNGTYFGTFMVRLKHLLNRNDRARAKKNISQHYDLGNEFYSLWLDPSMTYSSGFFGQGPENLQQAQLAKYDRAIDKLNLTEKDHLLEIGCGWGGFFHRAVEKTGCKVTAITLSKEQAEFAKRRIQDSGMENNVQLQLKDYRDIEGRFDKVVSIEMIEAVGAQYWDSYFQKISSVLKGGCTALIQAITIRDELFAKYSKGTDFIQQYIFPGGMLVSDNIVAQHSAKFGLAVTDNFKFGQDYAKTLEIWQTQFNQALPGVKDLGFDDNFINTWNMYLSYCRGAFLAERINVSQMLLLKSE